MMVTQKYANLTEAIRELLLSDADVVEMVGQNVFSDVLPQSQIKTAIAFWIVSEPLQAALDGPVGVDIARVQVDAFAETRREAVELFQRVRILLAGYRGVVAETFIKAIEQDQRQNLFDRHRAGTDQRRLIVSTDFLVTYDSIERVIQ